MTAHLYLIALGSNQRHPLLGSPREVVDLVPGLIDGELGEVLACAPIVQTEPVGPSLRFYANGALLLASELGPRDMLRGLQALETALGRRRMGQRWRARVVDLDIVLWSGGIWSEPDLAIPHPLFRTRTFVLGPAAAIVPRWRDPLTGLTLKQLHARLTRTRPLPR